MYVLSMYFFRVIPWLKFFLILSWILISLFLFSFKIKDPELLHWYPYCKSLFSWGNIFRIFILCGKIWINLLDLVHLSLCVNAKIIRILFFPDFFSYCFVSASDFPVSSYILFHSFIVLDNTIFNISLSSFLLWFCI